MSRLHRATYVIPTRRPLWQRVARRLMLAWMRHCRQCVIDELAAYVDSGMPIGPAYRANCHAQIDDYSARIALLEVNS